MRTAFLLALVGCVHAPPAAPTRTGAVYDVAVVSATGDRTVTALYALEVAPAGPRAWSVRTLRTAGTVDEKGAVFTFDSDEPQAGDPWPFLLQHAVAAVPAVFVFDDRGAPEDLVDPPAWEARAWEAIGAVGLPEASHAAAVAVVDGEGLVADLRRTFPGAPTDGPWIRPEHLGGFEAVRTESCEGQTAEGVRTWTCAGTLTSPDDGGAHLHDTTSTARVVADSSGLLSYESQWSGTLLWRDGEEVRDAPVGGRRLVRRR